MRDAPILAFDVGGSFVKAGLVNLVTGTVEGEVLRRPTPDGATPSDVIDLLASIEANAPAILHLQGGVDEQLKNMRRRVRCGYRSAGMKVVSA